ncbi:gluconokinase [Roseibium sp.]|uniref:gluconokinase n=1 Tax=Roseibium sp. TaxID=1936156 RepID=UPI003A9728D3
MGVCGVGKSVVAKGLSQALDIPMVEADDFHSPANKAKMSKGLALTDADRMPWLDAVVLAGKAGCADQGGAVIACSALRRIYRDRLRDGLKDCLFIHLTGDSGLIEARLNSRKNHFVGANLLFSQLSVLEPLEADETGFALDISLPADEVVLRALEALRRIEQAANDGAPTHEGTQTMKGRNSC